MTNPVYPEWVRQMQSLGLIDDHGAPQKGDDVIIRVLQEQEAANLPSDASLREFLQSLRGGFDLIGALHRTAAIILQKNSPFEIDTQGDLKVDEHGSTDPLYEKPAQLFHGFWWQSAQREIQTREQFQKTGIKFIYSTPFQFTSGDRTVIGDGIELLTTSDKWRHPGSSDFEVISHAWTLRYTKDGPEILQPIERQWTYLGWLLGEGEVMPGVLWDPVNVHLVVTKEVSDTDLNKERDRRLLGKQFIATFGIFIDEAETDSWRTTEDILSTVQARIENPRPIKGTGEFQDFARDFFTLHRHALMNAWKNLKPSPPPKVVASEDRPKPKILHINPDVEELVDHSNYLSAWRKIVTSVIDPSNPTGKGVIKLHDFFFDSRRTIDFESPEMQELAEVLARRYYLPLAETLGDNAFSLLIRQEKHLYTLLGFTGVKHGLPVDYHDVVDEFEAMLVAVYGETGRQMVELNDSQFIINPSNLNALVAIAMFAFGVYIPQPTYEKWRTVQDMIEGIKEAHFNPQPYPKTEDYRLFRNLFSFNLLCLAKTMTLLAEPLDERLEVEVQTDENLEIDVLDAQSFYYEERQRLLNTPLDQLGVVEYAHVEELSLRHLLADDHNNIHLEDPEIRLLADTLARSVYLQMASELGPSALPLFERQRDHLRSVLGLTAELHGLPITSDAVINHLDRELTLVCGADKKRHVLLHEPQYSLAEKVRNTLGMIAMYSFEVYIPHEVSSEWKTVEDMAFGIMDALAYPRLLPINSELALYRKIFGFNLLCIEKTIEHLKALEGPASSGSSTPPTSSDRTSDPESSPGSDMSSARAGESDSLLMGSLFLFGNPLEALFSQPPEFLAVEVLLLALASGFAGYAMGKRAQSQKSNTSLAVITEPRSQFEGFEIDPEIDRLLSLMEFVDNEDIDRLAEAASSGVMPSSEDFKQLDNLYLGLEALMQEYKFLEEDLIPLFQIVGGVIMARSRIPDLPQTLGARIFWKLDDTKETFFDYSYRVQNVINHPRKHFDDCLFWSVIGMGLLALLPMAAAAVVVEGVRYLWPTRKEEEDPVNDAQAEEPEVPEEESNLPKPIRTKITRESDPEKLKAFWLEQWEGLPDELQEIASSILWKKDSNNPENWFVPGQIKGGVYFIKNRTTQTQDRQLLDDALEAFDTAVSQEKRKLRVDLISAGRTKEIWLEVWSALPQALKWAGIGYLRRSSPRNPENWDRADRLLVGLPLVIKGLTDPSDRDKIDDLLDVFTDKLLSGDLDAIEDGSSEQATTQIPGEISIKESPLFDVDLYPDEDEEEAVESSDGPVESTGKRDLPSVSELETEIGELARVFSLLAYESEQLPFPMDLSIREGEEEQDYHGRLFLIRNAIKSNLLELERPIENPTIDRVRVKARQRIRQIIQEGNSVIDHVLAKGIRLPFYFHTRDLEIESSKVYLMIRGGASVEEIEEWIGILELSRHGTLVISVDVPEEGLTEEELNEFLFNMHFVAAERLGILLGEVTLKTVGEFKIQPTKAPLRDDSRGEGSPTPSLERGVDTMDPLEGEVFRFPETPQPAPARSPENSPIHPYDPDPDDNGPNVASFGGGFMMIAGGGEVFGSAPEGMTMGTIEVFEEENLAVAVQEDVGVASLPRILDNDLPENREQILFDAIALAEEAGLTEVSNYLELADDKEVAALFTDQKGMYANMIEAGLATCASQLSQAEVQLSKQEIVQLNAALAANALDELDALLKQWLPQAVSTTIPGMTPIVGPTHVTGVRGMSPVLRVVK